MLESCRSCRDRQAPFAYLRDEPVNEADVIVWGKLFPPSMLGPRCMGCFVDECHQAGIHPEIGGPRASAVFDLRKVQPRVTD